MQTQEIQRDVQTEKEKRGRALDEEGSDGKDRKTGW